MKYEYKTTYGDSVRTYTNSEYGTNEEAPASNPILPKGSFSDDKGEWEMCGMAASHNKLYWSWRRKIK